MNSKQELSSKKNVKRVVKVEVEVLVTRFQTIRVTWLPQTDYTLTALGKQWPV